MNCYKSVEEGMAHLTVIEDDSDAWLSFGDGAAVLDESVVANERRRRRGGELRLEEEEEAAKAG